MNDRKDQERIRQAIDHTLAGMQGDPWLAGKILRDATEEKPIMKRKLTFGLIMAIILILTLGTALAASLGLFGQLGQRHEWSDARLPDLDQVSDTVNLSYTTAGGNTVTIHQAYYDGARVFVSYSIEGNPIKLTLNEGRAGLERWHSETPAAEFWDSTGSEYSYWQPMREWLTSGTERNAVVESLSAHDGLFLMKGDWFDPDIYLDIYYGDSEETADGSIVGWKECHVPEELQGAEELNVALVIFGSTSVYEHADQTVRTFYQREQEFPIPFTVKKANDSRPMSGQFEASDYQTQAQMTWSRIDLSGTVTLACPGAWLPYYDWSGDGPDDALDAIDGFRLYSDGKPLENSGRGEEGMSWEDGKIIFHLLYRHGGVDRALSLVPVYRLTGEHPDEGLPLR
ncbi:MAG: DUF4179 domain-containing protein [Clostridia bacterium]|nr:DUF4179 domain-containing protein [Clostridia bacterium]